MQYAGNGDGRDGAPPASGVINTYAACTATGGTKTVTSALSVSQGDMVLLHQSRTGGAGGATAGAWEIVIVDTPGAGSFTVTQNLDNSYISGAQAVKIPQYTGGEITGTISAQAWDGSTGGIAWFVSTGPITGNGTINAKGKGFRGGQSISSNSPFTYGYYGESHIAYSTAFGSHAANYMGGGAGKSQDPNAQNGSGGGGGGGKTAGGDGWVPTGSPGGGVGGGGGYGSDDNTIMLFGGGGGSGGSTTNSKASGKGGVGGGIIGIFAPYIASTLIRDTRGDDGDPGTTDGSGISGGGGGGGGGPQIYKGIELYLDTTNCKAQGGAHGADNTGSTSTGGGGYVRAEGCTISGDSTPAASKSEGGYDFCQSLVHIY